MDVFEPVFSVSGYFLKYLLWRTLGMVLYGHTLAFEAMPFRQAVSMMGATLSFTHSKKFYSLTYAYEWGNFCAKKSPVIRLGIIGGTAQSGLYTLFQKGQRRAPTERW